MKSHHSSLLKFKKAKHCKAHNTSAEVGENVLALTDTFLKSNLYRNQAHLHVTATVYLYLSISKTAVTE